MASWFSNNDRQSCTLDDFLVQMKNDALLVPRVLPPI